MKINRQTSFRHSQPKCQYVKHITKKAQPPTNTTRITKHTTAMTHRNPTLTLRTPPNPQTSFQKNIHTHAQADMSEPLLHPLTLLVANSIFPPVYRETRSCTQKSHRRRRRLCYSDFALGIDFAESRCCRRRSLLRLPLDLRPGARARKSDSRTRL